MTIRDLNNRHIADKQRREQRRMAVIRELLKTMTPEEAEQEVNRRWRIAHRIWVRKLP